MKTEFNAQLARLKELQDIDLRLHEINIKLELLPERIAAHEAAYNQVKTEMDAAKHELAEAEKSRRHEELELASTTEHAKLREAKLYAIKTTKEYQAALKEIAETKKINKEREDRILGLMEQIENLGKKITQLDGELADKESAYRKEDEALKAEEAELTKSMDDIESRRPKLVSEIDVKVVRNYDYVRQRYPDALVHVEKGVCQGCSMNIPPQLYNEMLRSIEFKNCPSCRRLIYVNSEDAANGRNAQEDK
jgi:hypothetical protein